MIKELRIISIIGILLLQLLFATIILPLPTAGQSVTPIVELSLVEENVTSTPNPDGTGNVNFNGIVSVNMNQIVRVVVLLTASDTWGTAIVSPSSILFSQTGEKPFAVSLQVPSDEEYNSRGTMTVSGTWSMYPSGLSGPAESATGNIIVGPIINFSISTSQQNVIIDQGSKKDLELTIENRGNYIDSYSINLKNNDELTSLGFQVELESNIVEVPKGESETITITVYAPNKDISLLNNNVVIEVNSINGQAYNTPSKTMIYGLTISTKKSSRITDQSIIWIIGLLIVFLIILIFFRWFRKRNTNKVRYD